MSRSGRKGSLSALCRLRLVPTLLFAAFCTVIPAASAATVPLAPGFPQASLKLVVDNDYAVFMGDGTNVTRLFYQNNYAWMDQVGNATNVNITPLPGESYIYIAVMGGGGTEDFGGYLNGQDIVNVTGAQVASGRSPSGSGVYSSPYEEFQGFFSSYNIGDVANGVQNLDLATMQTALTGTSWSSAVATGSGNGSVPNYKTSGVCCSSSAATAAGLSGKGWDFPSNSLVVFRYPLTALALPVQAGNGYATVDWTAPASGDAPTGYVVQYKKSSDPDTSYTTFSTPVAPITFETVTGLTNGISYTFRVAGSNSYGTGAYSETRTATPTGPPIAPTNPSYVPVASGATISFTAPTSNGGSVLTNYEYSKDGGLTWSALSPADTISPISISGLTDGTTYSVSIRADNALGSGAASALFSVISGLVGRISNISFATNPIKGVRANVTATVNIPGAATFTIYGKRIPGCTKVATVGSAPTITATCAWKPATSALGYLSVSLVPSDSSYASSSQKSGLLTIGRRTGTR